MEQHLAVHQIGDLHQIRGIADQRHAAEDVMQEEVLLQGSSHRIQELHGAEGLVAGGLADGIQFRVAQVHGHAVGLGDKADIVTGSIGTGSHHSIFADAATLDNHGVGTDMSILGPVIAEKFGLSYSKTNDLEVGIEHLRAGGVIIAHVGIPKDATIGLFTKSGHYISLISTDGKEFCILDPSWSEEKYKIPERLGRVNEDNYPYLYCDVNTVHSETKPGRTKYHLFSRKKEQK